MKKNCNVFLASCFATIFSIINVSGMEQVENPLDSEPKPQVKSHVVILTITNNTGYSITNPYTWFDSGRVADGWSFPTSIATGTNAKVEMYEKDWSMAGCSGYVDYTMNNGRFTIAYSNPSVGSNKIGCGIGGKSVWDNMESHYSPTNVTFTLNNVSFKANIQSTSDSVNNATVILSTQ